MRALRLLVLAALTSAALTGCLFSDPPSAEVGDCLDVSALGSEVNDLPTIDCDEPHEAEVYSVFNLQHEGGYDISAITLELEDRCLEEFETFVGISYWQSDLDIYYFAPTSDGWRQGDREVICVVIAPDWDQEGFPLTLVTGSFGGSQR